MIINSLKSKTITALSWSFLESAGLMAVRFVIGIVLARLLFPEQYGLIGMLLIFMAVAQSFLDSGFGAALIQKRDATQSDICSIFYFNILIGLLAAGFLCLAAPWIATFYHQPILTALTRALSLTIIIDSFGLIQSTILTKQINFKTRAKISLVANILSGVIGITLAILGFGVWSLAVQQICSSLFRTILLWLLNSWRPVLIFSFRSLREMFRYGSRLLAAVLINQIFDNIYLLVIGKLFSAADLGFFTRARTVQDTPSQTVGVMVARVTFPVFSVIQDDPTRLKRGFNKALTTLALVQFPMMLGLAIIARPLVLLLLKERWSQCIPYIQLLCLAELLFPMHLMNVHILQALGRTDIILRLEVIKKVLIVINIALTWRWGIPAMIYGMMGCSIISYYLNSYYTGRLINYPIREQLRDLLSYLIIAVIMATSMYACGLVLSRTNPFMLLLQLPVGVLIYVFLCGLFRQSAFIEIWQIISGSRLSEQST